MMDGLKKDDKEQAKKTMLKINTKKTIKRTEINTHTENNNKHGLNPCSSATGFTRNFFLPAKTHARFLYFHLINGFDILLIINNNRCF